MFQCSNLRVVAHSVIIFSLFLGTKQTFATGWIPVSVHYYVDTATDDWQLQGLNGGPLSIRGAIVRASNDSFPFTPFQTVIHIPAGHFPITYRNGSNDNGIVPFDFVDYRGQNLEIRGAGRDVTFLDGGEQTFIAFVSSRTSDRPVTIGDLTVQNGRGGYGGGMRITGAAIFERCRFVNCVAGFQTSNLQGGSGGAIESSTQPLTIKDCIFEDCRGRNFGGAVYSQFGSVIVQRSIFIGNNSTSADGGAIYTRGSLAVSDSVFAENGAARQGGAITAYGPTTIDHCTIVNNRSNADGVGDGNGGGIRTVNGSSTLSNSIIAHNRNGAPGADAPDDLSGRLVSAGYNIVTAITEQTIIDGDVANDLIEFDPLLGPLDTAEELPFFPLRPGSPAIDAALNNNCSTYDLRARARPFDGDGDGIARCDIGAVEFRVTQGDMNCDNAITVSDIGGFVLALTQPSVYDASYPGCERFNADANGDGALTVSDISDFIALLQ